MQLGRAARDAVELLDGQLQRAIILGTASEKRSEAPDLENRLNRSFSKGVLVPDNQGPSIILQGRGKNFAGRGTLPAGQHNHRPVVGDTGIRIARDDDVSIRAL